VRELAAGSWPWLPAEDGEDEELADCDPCDEVEPDDTDGKLLEELLELDEVDGNGLEELLDELLGDGRLLEELLDELLGDGILLEELLELLEELLDDGKLADCCEDSHATRAVAMPMASKLFLKVTLFIILTWWDISKECPQIPASSCKMPASSRFSRQAGQPADPPENRSLSGTGFTRNRRGKSRKTRGLQNILRVVEKTGPTDPF
jgi:hypothetical protein